MGEKQRENKAVSEADTKKKRKEEKTKKTTKKHSDSVTKDTTTNISATKGKTGRNREGEREKEDKTDKKRKRGSSDDNSSLTSEEAYVDGVNKDENFTGADLENFRISPSTLKRLREKGIAKLFPIQVCYFPHMCGWMPLTSYRHKHLTLFLMQKMLWAMLALVQAKLSRLLYQQWSDSLLKQAAPKLQWMKTSNGARRVLERAPLMLCILVVI